MPANRNRRKRKRSINSHLPSWLMNWFYYGIRPEGFNGLVCDPRRQRENWKAIRDDVVRDWIRHRPGTRPYAWWKFDNPERGKARIRLGGIGTPYHEVSGMRSLAFGVPDDFVNDNNVQFFRDRDDVNDFNIVDPTQPPKYESQATYLKRHGLLVSGESRRIKKKNFEPETIFQIFDKNYMR